jgi:hypothetical protein
MTRRVGFVPCARNGRTAPMERRKTGRPSKGPRKRKPLQLPIPLAEAAEAEARRSGMTFNDLCARLLADHLLKQGIPVEHPSQQELPLTV